MTFAAILADLYRRLGYQLSPAPAVVTSLKALCNETHDAILAEPGLESLLDAVGSVTFASVASQARYGLANVAQINAITETTNDRKLTALSLSAYRSINPDPASNEGTPVWYVPLGIVALQRTPATTGTGLWAVSSSAADTGGPTALLDCTRVGGYPHTPTAVALTGTTRVQIGTLTDYVDVQQFTLSAACAGDVSLYDAAADGNVLAVIPRGQTASRYSGFLLSPTPSAAVTYTVDAERESVTLSVDNDEPLLPVRFHRLIGIGARVRWYEQTGDMARYPAALAEYNTELAKLKYAVTCPPGQIVIPGGGRGDGGSNLGAWYPAGRW